MSIPFDLIWKVAALLGAMTLTLEVFKRVEARKAKLGSDSERK